MNGFTGPGRIAACLLAAAVVACSGGDKEEYVEREVHVIYNEAMDALENGDHAEAATQFDEVERQHPYSVWATRAQLMGAYARYEANDYDGAVIALDRFIQLHPGNRDIAYAHYLKSLCYYEQISGVVRDQSNTEKARQALQDVVRRFPQSAYARDAGLKLDLTRDHLAGKEMHVGRYYQRRGHFLAAINRFRRVVDDYQTTTHAPEALHRLVEAYTALGIADEARKVAAVLGHNYPGSAWYADSYALVSGIDPVERNGDGKGFFARVRDWIL